MKSNKLSKRHLWVASTAVYAILAGTAYAQDPGPVDASSATDPSETSVELAEEQDEVVVVGVRQALKSAEDIKKNADSFVDSITATDIGAFPDKSIAEALQRVPGVTVVRTASPEDATHYAAEPSGVIIRGLTQTRSEFNGRDAFSATSGSGLNFEDISPILLSRVDTFKNQTAEMIEGGIAGTVNLVTRLPFDQDGELISASLTGTYGDIRQELTPEISGIYSNRWQTKVGEFGFLASGTYSDLKTTSQGAVSGRMAIFDPGTYTDEENYIPSGLIHGVTNYDRIREGLSFAGQYETNDGKFLLTAQYNNSRYDNTWRERQLENFWQFIDQAEPHSLTFSDPNFVLPPDGGMPFSFQDNGLFGMGTVTRSAGSGAWGYGTVDWGTSPEVYLEGSTDQYGVFEDGTPRFTPCLNYAPLHEGPCPLGVQAVTKSRYSTEERFMEDIALNAKWAPTDSFRMNFDYQRVNADTNKYDITVGFNTYANLDVDLTGDYPSVSLLPPSNFGTIGNDIFSDPRNYYPASAMDHRTESVGQLDAFRVDAVKDFNSKWIQDVRVGARFSERTQEHKWSAFNWQAIAADWGTNFGDAAFLTADRTFNDDGTVRFQGYEPGYYETRQFGENLLGGGLVNENLVFMNFDILEDPAETALRFSVAGQTDEGGLASTSWVPICDRANELLDSCFTPGEIVDVSEETAAAYVMARFGGDEATLFGLPVTGNVGVRLVETTVKSTGSVNYPVPFTDAQLNCQPLSQEVIDNLGENQYAVSPECLAAGSTADQNFSTGGSTESTITTTHNNVLPSFNMRLEVAEETYLRFAASRAISKPDIGLLKNYSVIQRGFLPQSSITVDNEDINLDSNGNPVSYNFPYRANANNPRLKPIKATQFDVSIEKYFEPVGSFTATGFYKKFEDYIQNGVFTVPYESNGVTRDVTVTGPVNGDGAKIYGLELSGLKYFDMLPAPFDGFGIQANYTYVKNDGVQNTNLVTDTTGESSVARSSQSNRINPGRLEGLSTHSANIIGLYEKGKIGARLAYNWRSKYLLSVNDCCVGFPVWSDSEGFLDGSIRYALTDNFEFNVQMSNILGTKSKTKAQVRGPSEDNPKQESKFFRATTFEYDSRIQFGVRAKF